MFRQKTTLPQQQQHYWLLLFLLGCVARSSAAETPPPSAKATNESRIHIGAAGGWREEIRTKVVGDFYVSPTTERVPGIILLGGSDGKPMTARSALLTSHGYAVLNLFYFGHGLLPKEFAEVPVEYLTNAVSWLQAGAG